MTDERPQRLRVTYRKADALRYVEQELPLTPAERRQILWDTPARLFGFAATSAPAGSRAAAER